jgi:hypothetical protein
MAQQDKGDLDQAMENYQKGVDLDPSNSQCKQMLELAEAQLMQRMMGGMGVCQEWAAWEAECHEVATGLSVLQL